MAAQRPAGKRSYERGIVLLGFGGNRRAGAEGSQSSYDAGGHTMSQEPIGGPMDLSDAGKQMHRLISDLYPICRSITGDGFRETLRQVRKHISLEVREVPSGTKVFDWTVPREWNIRDAWVKNLQGEKVIDFQKANLHVVSYSVPVRRRMQLAELREHLHTLPDRPDWIPYRTSYYKEDWGFCLTHSQLERLDDGEYEVCIESRLEEGSLTYGEYFIPGNRTDEVLLSCHACHPSLCDDNLSGVALVTRLAKLLSEVSLNYSYRFLFIPGTIGSITWLAQNEARVSRIRHGLVVACVGDPGKFHYKKSRRGNAEIDRAAIHALCHCGVEFEVLDFSPYGYDERAVLLARIQPVRRQLDADAARPLPAVPHLGRRSGLRPPRGPRRFAGCLPVGRPDPGEQRLLHQHESQVRAATREERALPGDRRTRRRRPSRDGDALGPQPLGR